MKTSEKGYNLIRLAEGLVLRSYKCPADVWTIGYGHTKGVKSGQSISRQQAEDYLVQDVRTCETGLNSLGLKLNQYQYDALISFIFNLGLGNFSKSTLLKKIAKNPNDPAIADEFRKWVYSGGVVVRGLRTRRENEIELYFTI